MSRVAILGSCITRDLWPIRGDGAEDLLYVSRTSLPSLFAPPVAAFTPSATAPEGLTRHQHEAAVADLRKTALRRLVAFAPTHLILDLIDERFDLMAAGGSVITRSWELEAGGYLRSPALAGARTIPRLSAACERLWDEAAVQLAGLVRASRLRGATLILHSARWAERSRAPSGKSARLSGVEILAGQAADIGEHNSLLARYEARLRALMPPMAQVEAPALRIADHDHRWGLSPFHYVSEYYEAIWSQLEALGVRRPEPEADKKTPPLPREARGRG